MSTGDTKPVYISEEQKRTVKSEGGLIDESMKTIINRLVVHGVEKGLHKVPVDEDPDEHSE